MRWDPPIGIRLSAIWTDRMESARRPVANTQPEPLALKFIVWISLMRRSCSFLPAFSFRDLTDHLLSRNLDQREVHLLKSTLSEIHTEEALAVMTHLAEGTDPAGVQEFSLEEVMLMSGPPTRDSDLTSLGVA